MGGEQEGKEWEGNGRSGGGGRKGEEGRWRE